MLADKRNSSHSAAPANRMWLAPKKSLQSLSAIPGDCIHALEILFARAMSHVRESAKRLLREAENFLHEKIPITRAMGIRVISSGNEFAIEAPVALNFNHLGTGFGGSINAVATLAGYVFLWIELHEIPRSEERRVGKECRSR